MAMIYYQGEVRLGAEIPEMLPTDAILRGWQLKYLEPPGFVILLDRGGRSLFEWWEHIPSLGEIFDKCLEILSNQSRAA